MKRLFLLAFLAVPASAHPGHEHEPKVEQPEPPKPLKHHLPSCFGVTKGNLCVGLDKHERPTVRLTIPLEKKP